MRYKRVLLVKPSGRRGLGFAFELIPLSLEYIAAYIEDAVEDIHIVDMEQEKRNFHHLIDLYRPDLVGITVSATEHNEALRLAKIADENGIATVVGGYHPTGIPDMMLSNPEIKMVVRGEGERTMREIVEKGCPEGVLGVSYRKYGKIIHNGDRSKIEDLDSIPFPARHLRQYSYRIQDQSTSFDVLATSRGCQGQCTYCCEPNMNQGRLRCRSPENVMEEILEMVKYHKENPLRVVLTDPNFIGNPERVDHLCELLIEHDLNVEFSALVRSDYMARNPEIVKKMCKAGIISFEMGIESPNPEDLNSTKKGLTIGVHRQAVQNIRENGGNAGGTFVIGLPNQTEEDIMRFPIYAKEIGLTSSAFGIATPFPGTEFFDELNEQGLIFETNWDNFDEMHSVYKTKNLSKDKIEKLATYCMAKFWNIDTFIDQTRVSQKRKKKKTSLMNFVRERAFNVGFMSNNGMELQKENFGNHIKTFLAAYPDPRVEEYTRKVGVHNVLEMSKFLRILGPQTLQCMLRYDDTTISFIIKTTKKTVEYIRVIPGRQHSTINLDIDLKWMSEPRQQSKMNMAKSMMEIVFNDKSLKRLWNTFKLFTAVGVEFLSWKLS